MGSSTGPTDTCHDDKFYRGRLGMTCVDHDTPIACAKYIQVGFSDDEAYQLILNCPRTCGICESVANPSLVQFIFKMQVAATLNDKNNKKNNKEKPSASSQLTYHYPTYYPTYIPTKNPTRHPSKNPTRSPVQFRTQRHADHSIKARP